MHGGIGSRMAVWLAVALAASLSACGVLSPHAAGRASASSGASPTVKAEAWKFVSRPDLAPPVITSTLSTGLPW